MAGPVEGRHRVRRRWIAFGATLAASLVVASPANAGPIIAAVSAAAAAFQALPLIAQLVVRFVVGFAISAAAGSLLAKTPPKPQAIPLEDPGRTDTIRQGAAPRASVYGETRVGGIVVYAEASGGEKNQFLSVLIAVAGHEIAGFEEFWFADEALVLSGDAVQGRFLNHANVYTHIGTDTQAADSVLVAASEGGWTTAHRLRRIAYWHARLKWPTDQDDDYDRIWTDFHLDGMRARVRGKLLYDPRDAGTRFSNNPALAIRDYLVNRLQVTAAEIDDTTVSAAANVCEEQVDVVNTTQTFTADATTDVLTLTDELRNLRRGCVVRVSTDGTLPTGLSAGVDYYYMPVTVTSGRLATSYANALAGTQIDITGAGSGTHTLTLRSEPRYTMAAVVLDSDEPGLVLRTMAQSMGGAVAYTGGKWSVWAGESGTATITLDEDDLVGPITVAARRPRNSIFNAVKPLYRDPDRFYQQATAPGIENSTYVSDDNGDEIWQELQLPFTDTDTAAQRLAKIELERARQQISVDFPARLTALQLKVWDVVNVTHANFGWSAKKFRVIGLRMNDDDSVQLTLTEEAAAMWSWSAEETTVDPAPDTNLPNYRNVSAPPTPISVTEELRTTASGTVITVLSASVNVSNDQFTTRYDWQWKKSSDSTYTTLPNSRNANVEIAAVTDGQAYDIRVRAVNTLGFKSAYISKSYTPIGRSAPPENVTNFAVNVVGQDAILTWTAVGDVDLSHYVIRHSKQTAGVTWSNSIPLVSRVAKPATSVAVPAMTGTYAIKAVDQKGNESATVATVGVSIAALPDNNLSQTITEEPSFAGTHVDTWVTPGDVLQLHVENDQLSDWSALDAVAVMAFGEDSTATFVTSGTYTFATAVDAGGIVVARVRSKMEALGSNYTNLLLMWPTMAGVTTMAGGSTGKWDVTLQIRTTTDDPTGAPTWTAWQDFVVGDYRAWGMEFRARLESTFGPVTPQVSEMQVDVEYTDRVEAAADVAVGAGGATVTYGTAFNSPAASISIAITAQNLAQGDYWTITNKTKTGFGINFYNSAGAGVARTVDYQARGY